MKIRTFTIILVFFSFISLGCGSTYHAPRLQHSYITNTQQQHALTGIDVFLDGSAGSDGVLAATGSGTSRSLYMDGREAYSTAFGSGIRTFIQLPPGQHEAVYEAKFRTIFVIVGVPWGTWRESCLFNLQNGIRGYLKIDMNSTEPKMIFENIAQPECILQERTGFFK